MLEKMYEITNSRAMANCRIQKKDDFAVICESKTYQVRKRESSLYRRYMIKRVGKLVGVVNLVANVLTAPNNGYPEGFTNYITYDEKRNPKN